MNTIDSANAASTDFPGAVIDPATGRTVARAMDIARWLGKSPATIAKWAALGSVTRRAGGQYLDAAEAAAAMRNAKRPGRPRLAAMLEDGMAEAAMLTLVGTMAGAAMLLPVLGRSATTLRGAVAWQDQTVAVAEELGLSCAKPARAEWDARRPVAMARIEAAEAIGKAAEEGQ